METYERIKNRTPNSRATPRVYSAKGRGRRHMHRRGWRGGGDENTQLSWPYPSPPPHVASRNRRPKARFRQNPVKLHRRSKRFSTNRPDRRIPRGTCRPLARGVIGARTAVTPVLTSPPLRAPAIRSAPPSLALPPRPRAPVPHLYSGHSSLMHRAPSRYFLL